MQPITLSFAFTDPNEAAAFLVSVSNIGKAPAALESGPLTDTSGVIAGNSAPATAATKPVASARSSRTAEAVAADAPAPSTKPQESEKPTAAPAPAPSADKVAYAELQSAVLKLHKLDASAALPIATGMGFANFKSMPEDKWGEALKKVKAATAEREVV